ncbi:heparanase-like protein 1 [Impatiens glandulifera]|uniref:heparanase-like protein 1 n=1 Tax=Impatiens glandulifera TaxID=253017 RepID=UPI001FB0D125|nr:heparanase-like protein 1 [Impatiens glandulifera]
MGIYLPLILLILVAYANNEILAQNVEEAAIVVNATTPVAFTDDSFVCATIDWWPSDKCNYNNCPWGSSSVLNLDLVNTNLAKAVLAFNSLRIRIGGSLQDQVLYGIGDVNASCQPFTKMAGRLFGFSKGCLSMDRWDKLNQFFKETRARITFGLNALRGRHAIKGGSWVGNWNSTNAYDFIKYTISKGYQIDSWEYGNELSGKGIGARVGAEQYGKDVIKLKAILDELYDNNHNSQLKKPLLAAPGGFFDKEWYTKLLQVSGPNVVNLLTHHMYNLGAGVDKNITNKILDPNHLSRASTMFANLKQTIETSGPWSSAWVGESGGAYNNGAHNVSDTFVNSFWYLDQLGMSSTYGTKVYCRQTLIGANYGLLDIKTYIPNPDYYSALLWHRLMGKEVLSVNAIASPYLRSYAHCTKGRTGITLLLINLSHQTDFIVNVRNIISLNMRNNYGDDDGASFTHRIKKSFSWVGSKASDVPSLREEYHLTSKDGSLHSKTMLLNGQPLELTNIGDIPSLNHLLFSVNSPISIPSLSIKFIVFPNFDAPICKKQV